MKLALDTADLEKIKYALKQVEFDHITTNPALITQACHAYETEPRELLKEILSLGVETSVETLNGAKNYKWDEEVASKCIEEAEAIAKLGSNVVVKIGATPDGMVATRCLYPEIKVNATLGFHPAQGRIAARAGAHYYSVFIGRMIANNFDGFGAVKEAVANYKEGDYGTQVLAASIRTFDQLEKSYELGAHIATISWSAFEEAEKTDRLDRLKEMQKNVVSHTPAEPVDVRMIPLDLWSEPEAFKHDLLFPGGQSFMDAARKVEYDPLQL